MYDVVVHIVVV